MMNSNWDLDGQPVARRLSIGKDTHIGRFDALPSTPEASPPEICAAAGGSSVAAICPAVSSLRGLHES